MTALYFEDREVLVAAKHANRELGDGDSKKNAPAAGAELGHPGLDKEGEGIKRDTKGDALKDKSDGQHIPAEIPAWGPRYSHERRLVPESRSVEIPSAGVLINLLLAPGLLPGNIWGRSQNPFGERGLR